jgi:hypothetical protein
MRPVPLAVLLVVLAVLGADPLLAIGCGQHEQVAPPVPSAFPSDEPHRLGWAPGNAAFFYTAGTAGTVTVSAGSYVTGLSAHATGGGATLTITPSGPQVTSPAAGPGIPIPAGGAYSLSRPVLVGNSNELGTGSTLVFAGTDAYIVTFYQAGGP